MLTNYLLTVVPPTLAYLRRKRSTRPAVSISFCLPVKNGWQLEQISTWISPRCVERVVNVLPHAQCTRTSLYAGWIVAFIETPEIMAELFDSKGQVKDSANGCESVVRGPWRRKPNSRSLSG